jgi:hypothetical protein
VLMLLEMIIVIVHRGKLLVVLVPSESECDSIALRTRADLNV